MSAFRHPLAVVALVSMLSCDDGNGPTEPGAGDLTGAWTGTSTYPNAPFQLDLTQTDRTLRGQYRDRLDDTLTAFPFPFSLFPFPFSLFPFPF